METITSVEKIKKYGWMGYRVTTTVQKIRLLIEDVRICCKDWDIYMTFNDLRTGTGSDEEFIKSLIGLEVQDISFGKRPEENDAAIIRLKTDQGPLQIVFCNDHNCFYRDHKVKASWSGFHEEQEL